jgi:hypothetical protein
VELKDAILEETDIAMFKIADNAHYITISVCGHLAQLLTK